MFTNIKFFNKLHLNHSLICDIIRVMKKIVSILSLLLFTTFAAHANINTNPFFSGYENQFAFNFGFGVNSGFLLPPPTQLVPFNIMHVQYSQPTTFFRLPARKSLNIMQTLGHGSKYGWNWDKYTIPIAMLSEDIIPLYGDNWYTFIGFGAGFQAQQNKRIGSKLLFSFKLGAGYKISDCVGVELFVNHFSNGNTAPENNSYAFYGAGITYSF